MSIKRFILVTLLTFIFATSIKALPKKKLPKKYRKIQQYIDRATSSKLAGVAIYIQTPKHKEWTTTSGYSNLKRKEPLKSGQFFSLGSIGKMYNAVAVLKLVEDGKLSLDGKISAYLPEEIINNLSNAKDINIRHLLGHTSGLINYDTDAELNRLYLSGQLKLDTLNRINTLRRYVYGKPALCLPGREYHYSSTNYLLLAMIMDSVTSKGHTDYLNKLLVKYGFTDTYYRQTPPEKNISYYGDLNQDEILEDLTAQTIETTNWFTGDDGVYATIDDAAHFLQDLMKGKILNQQSLKTMQTWNDERKPDYGLGLMADKSFPYHFLMGHSGRGIGVTTDLYYFPKQDITVAIFCNTGLRASAPGFKKTYNKMRSRIVKKLFLF